MNFVTIFNDHFVLVVFVASLMLGYLIKRSFDFIDNKYIPTILAVFGLVLNGFVNGFTIDSMVFGAFMGLSSTGAHQAFKQWVEKLKGTSSGE